MPCCRGTTPTTQREGTLSGTVCVSVRLGDGWGRVWGGVCTDYGEKGVIERVRKGQERSTYGGGVCMGRSVGKVTTGGGVDREDVHRRNIYNVWRRGAHEKRYYETRSVG